MLGSRLSRAAQVVAFALAGVVLLASIATADNLQADLVVATSDLDKTISRGTLSPGTGHTQSVFLFVQETSGGNNPSYPFDVTLGGATLDGDATSATFTGVTISASGSGNGQTGTIGWTTPAAGATSEDYSLVVSFDTNTTINESPATVTIEFTIAAAPASDTTPPNTTINSAPASPISSTSASFTYSSSESGSTFECKLDGDSFASCPAAGKSYSSLGEGSHTFQVRAIDAAGNVDATPASHTWTVDTVAPDTSITSGPSGTVSSTTATFTYSSPESGAVFQCNLDSAGWVSCPASGETYTGLGEGAHTFQVRAADALGNADASPASRSWTVDVSAPDTTIVTGPPVLTNSDSASFTYSSTESGSSFECKLDSGDFASCAEAGKSYTGLGEGPHTFSVRATDGAGNTDATPASHGWTIDMTPPAVSAPDLTDASDTGVSQIDNFTKDATPSFTGTAEDGATVELLRDDVVVDSATATGGEWSFTSETLVEGTYSFKARATDAAGNQAASTLLSVVVDLTNPSIVETSRLPAANGDGWNNSAVTVTWNCADDFSGVVAATDSDTVSGEGAGQSASGSCSDIAGNSANASHDDINIDLTAPEATASATSNSLPYTAGTWTKYDVIVTFGCTDALSGQATLTGPATVAEGQDQSSTGTCTDKAGNSDDATFSNIDVDKTAPAASASAKTADDAEYVGGTWTNQDVTVTFDCTDALSGVASLDPASTTLSASLADQSASSTCTDNAGNEDEAAFGNVDIDKVAPGIAFLSRTPAANSHGWNNSAVTVTWNCSDALSGPTSATVSDTKSGENGDQVANGTCADNAGNTAGASVSNIDIDLTDPYGIAWVGGPADGASYYFGSVPAAPTCSAFDDLSGVASCNVTGYGTGVGSHTLIATATDYAGNDVTATRSYTVLAWNLRGFYSPVDMTPPGGAPVWNTVKGGSTVPLKWEMFTDVEITDAAAITSITATPVTCSGGTADDIEVTSTGGTTSPRYDWTAGQFIYNWQTPKKPGACYRLTMAAGGTSISALFKLK